MLSLRKLTEASRLRSSEIWGNCDRWSISDWFMALVGEVGELGNILKKKIRGDIGIEPSAIAEELGGSLIYLVLLADHLGIDLEQAVINEFNRVSAKVGSKITL